MVSGIQIIPIVDKLIAKLANFKEEIVNHESIIVALEKNGNR